MTIYYAKSTNGFYSSDINPVIPADAVEITEDIWLSMLEGQSKGQVIQGDAKGNPVLVGEPIVKSSNQV